MTKRIAVAVEIEVEDTFDYTNITVVPHGLGLEITAGPFSPALLRATRYEVHFDPEAIFGLIESEQ